jgi:hypothetical protein
MRAIHQMLCATVLTGLASLPLLAQEAAAPPSAVPPVIAPTSPAASAASVAADTHSKTSASALTPEDPEARLDRYLP